MKRKRVLLASAALALATLCPSLAQAESSAANKAMATQLFSDAQKLMAQGNYPAACGKFHESQRLDPELGTLLHLADCYQKTGKTASAWAAFNEGAQIAAKRGDKRARIARQRAAALEAKLAHLTIQVSGGGAAGLQVRLDGEVIGRPVWNTSVPADPGPHTIDVTATGRQARHYKVTIAPSASKQVVVEPGAPSKPAAPEKPAASAAGSNPGSNSELSQTLVQGAAAGPGQPERQHLPVFAPIVHAGLLLFGSGTLKDTCNGPSCTSTDGQSADYSHQVAFALDADFLWRLGSLVRLGPGVMFVTGQSVKLQSGKVFILSPYNTKTEPSIGSDLAIDAVVEIDPQVSGKVWLAPRVQGGMGLLLPSGDLSDRLNYLNGYCPSTYDGCNSVSGAHFGWHAGLGFGVVYALNSLVRLRADVLAQYYSFSLFSIQQTADGTKYTEGISSSRGFLFLGAEF